MLMLVFPSQKKGALLAARQIMAARTARHLVGARIPIMMPAGMSTANAKRRKLLLRVRAKAKEPMEKVNAKVAVTKAKAKAPTRRVTRPALKLLVRLKRLELLLLELIPHFHVIASVWIHGQMCT